MEHTTLSNLINVLEIGTKLHICVAFLANSGNRKTRCTHSQSVHDRPICMAVKMKGQGLSTCYRCRNVVIRKLLHSRKPVAGYCANGVYEYCRPVVYDNRVIGIIFIGNILTDDPVQRERLLKIAGPELWDTMERNVTPAQCVKLADVLESYIQLLFVHYGNENTTFDPLVENVKTFVRENMNYDFTMEEMAAAFNYTPKYLGRTFKLRTGRSIKDYCNYVRVRRAKKLLSGTDIGIESVAMRAGFNSVNYFDRVFRRVTGMTPQNYRKTFKKSR